MRYDDIIRVAQEQDPGPNPGPDFSTLLTASAATGGAASKSLVGWLLAGLGAVTLVGGAAILLSSGPEQVTQPTAEPSPVAAKAVSEPPPPPEPTPPVIPPVAATPSSADPQVVPEAEPDDAAPATKADELEDPEAIYRRAEKHLGAGRLGAARKDFRRIVNRFPTDQRHSIALIDLAKLEARMGKAQSAACRYQAFLARYPRDMMAADARKALAKLGRDPEVDLGRCK